MVPASQVRPGDRIRMDGVVVTVTGRRVPIGNTPNQYGYRYYRFQFEDNGNGLPRQVRGNEIVLIKDCFVGENETIEKVEI